MTTWQIAFEEDEIDLLLLYMEWVKREHTKGNPDIRLSFEQVQTAIKTYNTLLQIQRSYTPAKE